MPLQAGHQDVEQDQIHAALSYDLDSLLTVHHGDNLVAVESSGSPLEHHALRGRRRQPR